MRTEFLVIRTIVKRNVSVPYDSSLATCHNTPHGRDQPIEFYRLAVELVASRGECLFTLAGKRMCGQSDDGDAAGLRIALESPRGFPAIDNRHFEVHKDDIRPLERRQLAPLLAVLRRQHLEIAEQLKPHLEHIDVVLVVFDVKHFGHDADSMPPLTAARVSASRRMRSTRSAGRKVSLTSTDWTPEFNSSRSSASRSSAVITMTGMSRQSGSFCKVATTWKPFISGIIRSSRIKSGLPCWRRSSASLPFAASCTIHC